MIRPNLALVVPCYNEEEALPETARRLLALRADLVASQLVADNSAIWFVDDGSHDRTWALIEMLAAAGPYVHGIKLSRNRGHQNALLAGLFGATGDAVVTIDADLQDDPAAIGPMVTAFVQGADIVYGVRRRRDADTVFKRLSARAYYRLLRWLGVDIVSDHADFRLLSRRAVDALAKYEETNLFLRGIIPQMGLPSTQVPYDRAPRLAGTTKYPLRRMLAFAVQGITSFSAAPLRVITVFGLTVSVASFAGGLWALYQRLVHDTLVPGWASTLVPVFFLGGIQLLSLGVIGEYVARIYMESKRRPRYVVERSV